jgi:hypothetical protein
MDVDLSRAMSWRKSSFSNGGGACVEVATNLPGMVGLRDSKNPYGPMLVITADAWHACTAGIRDGQFEL